MSNDHTKEDSISLRMYHYCGPTIGGKPICFDPRFLIAGKPMTAKGNYETNPLGLAEAVNDVAAFHRTFGHPILDKPGIPSPQRQTLRAKLIRDEYIEEFDPAWAKCAKLQKERSEISGPYTGEELSALADSIDRESVDALTELGDAITDVIYYLIGTSLEYGIPLESFWQVVQQANMSKLWTTKEIDTEGHKPGWRYERVLENKSYDPQFRCYVAYDETGKVRKPPSWQDPAPKLKDIIRKAMKGESFGIGTSS